MFLTSCSPSSSKRYGSFILEEVRQLVPDLIAHGARDAQAARFREALQASRDIHPIPEQIAVVLDDVAQIDAYPEQEVLALRQIGVAVHHAALHLDSAAHGFDGACELDQQAIAGCLNNVPTMFADQRAEEFASVGLQAGQRAVLVRAHEARIARGIGGQDGGEPALNL